MTEYTLSTDPTVRQRHAPEPTVNLVGLPEIGAPTPPVSLEVDAHLAEIEVARQRQLDALSKANLDAVAAAYRASIERVLEDVRIARRRVVAGLYGTCTGCRGEISLARLELRPWATTCATCVSRDRY